MIEFFGLSPQAKKKSGFGRKRALVTIEMFQLDDDDERAYLFKRRAMLIYLLFTALEKVNNGNTQQQAEGQAGGDFLTSSKCEHTNCLRCFKKLYDTDFPKAEIVSQEAFKLWTTGSP